MDNSLFIAREEVAMHGNLRRLGRVSIDRGTDHEGPILWFADETQQPIQIQTKPSIHLTWCLMAPDVW